MFIEGGDATLLVTGFLIRLGFIDYYIAIPMVIIAAITRDIILYKIGKKYGKKFIDRFGKYLLVTPETFAKIENRLRKTKGKTVFFSKFIYGLNHVSIIAVGTIKMNFTRFLKINILTILIWQLIMLGLGFFLADNFYLVRRYVKDFSVFLALSLVAFYLIESIVRKFIKFNGKNV
jgi:membrane protein DedA with SNARE-associated domain